MTDQVELQKNSENVTVQYYFLDGDGEMQIVPEDQIAFKNGVPIFAIGDLKIVLTEYLEPVC